MFDYVIYISVICIASLLGFLSGKSNVEPPCSSRCIFRKGFFLFSFLVAWFPLAFTKNGIDYDNYYAIIRDMSWGSIGSNRTLEPVMNIIFILSKSLAGGNIHLAIFFIKTATLAISFYSIYLVRRFVHVGYCVMAYMLCFYLPSFYLLALCLACSIVLLAVVSCVFYKKYLLGFLLLVFSAQLHNACYAAVFLALLCFATIKARSATRLIEFVFAIFALVGAVFCSEIMSVASRVLPFFHYGNYLGYSQDGTGIFVYFVFLPLFFLLFLVSKAPKANRKNGCKNVLDAQAWLFMVLVAAFAFAIMNYKVRVLDRMELIFVSYYIYLFPVCVRSIRSQKMRSDCTVLFIICLLFRGALVIIDRVNPHSGLLNYSLFNPFVGQ